MRTAGRPVANALLLGGALFLAFVFGMFYVVSHLSFEEGSGPDRYGDEDGGRRTERTRVVRSGERGWPLERVDPAEVPPGSPPPPVRVTVRGRVVGPDGEGITGAAVSVGGTWVTSGADGTFEAESPADDPRPLVGVLAPGYRLPEPRRARADGEVELRLERDREVTVRGLVTDDAGAPLPEADVAIRVYRAPGSTDAFADLLDRSVSTPELDLVRAGFAATSRTAADGSYALRVPSVAAHFMVVADAAGHAKEWSEPVHVAAGEDTYDVSLVLTALRTLRGRVLDASTSLPVAGAIVSTWLSADGQTDADAVATDAAGEFVIPDAPRSNVYVLADGYLRAQFLQGKDEPRLDVRLTPARVVAGRVELTDGTPVPGAYVSLRGPGARPPGVRSPQPAYTDADGRFRFDDAWDAEWTVMAALTDRAELNFLTADGPTVVPGGGDVVVVVQRARAISGRVLGPDGEPLAGVYVSCEESSGAAHTHERVFGNGAGVRSGSDGRFELRGLRDGTFRVKAGATPPGMPSYGPVEVDGVAAGASDVELRMALGLSLRGRVVDEEGAPVAGRRVLALDAEHVGMAYHAARGGVTDEDGRFEIHGLEERAYRLQLEPVAPEWQRCRLDGAESVRPSDASLALRLSTGASISGVVVDGSGSPVAGAEVQAVPMGEPSRIESRTSTDPQGRFTVRGLLASRRYRLHAAAATVDDVAPGTQNVRIE